MMFTLLFLSWQYFATTTNRISDQAQRTAMLVQGTQPKYKRAFQANYERHRNFIRDFVTRLTWNPSPQCNVFPTTLTLFLFKEI
jgi:hypothetical protein